MHFYHSKGSTKFVRNVELPFAPQPGLDFIDELLGEFRIEHVAWSLQTESFYLQSRYDGRHWLLRDAVRKLKKFGWEELKELREAGHHEEIPSNLRKLSDS
ncbi:hypothetical protein VN12_08420 [Pirellula sp. SH-Sr6A]|nr:hypothetical protein VN12_08420 [Pirellula sp. SH-Sr6A]